MVHLLVKTLKELNEEEVRTGEVFAKDFVEYRSPTRFIYTPRTALCHRFHTRTYKYSKRNVCRKPALRKSCSGVWKDARRFLGRP